MEVGKTFTLLTQASLLIMYLAGVAQTQEQSFDFNGESDLDLEYAFALTNPQVRHFPSILSWAMS